MKFGRLPILILLTTLLVISACMPKTSHYFIEDGQATKYWEYWEPDTTYFSPNSDLAKHFAEHILEAEKTVIVHSDSMLPPVIINALRDIVNSEVQVGVILNESNLKKDTNVIDTLTSAGIHTYVDTLNDLPSGEVAVIDGLIVLEGSFISNGNGGESLLLYQNPYYATLYTRGWLVHTRHSILYKR